MGKEQPELVQIQQGIETGFNLKVSNLHDLAGGIFSDVYQASTFDEDVIIRVARDGNSYPTEIWAYGQFRSLGIPCPIILAYQENPVAIGHPTMIMEKAPGAALSGIPKSSGMVGQLYEELGGLQQRINSVVVSGYGELGVQNDVALGKYSSWAEFLQSPFFGNAFEYLRDKQLVSNDNFVKAMQNYAEISKTDVRQGFLLHNDLHAENVFADGGKIVGIIDPGNAISGDPRWDIAMSLFFQDDAQQQAFKKGYGELASDPVVDKYQLFIATYKLALRHKRGSPNLGKSLEVFQRLIEV